ncbi:MAG: biotin--[acetyl-CoA-carboxylase] ligase [Bacillota bacterium]|nr:biotin--[acetyl-CoA-carboxylase] ligase [Bacillota bacterium]
MSIKNEVLKLLQNNANYLSGEDMAQQLNVSRTAVWKAIKSLQHEGYEIFATSNKGYKLGNADILSKEGIEQYLTVDCSLEVQSLVTSTNTLMVQRAIAGEKEKTILIAGAQSQGRGRTGHTFYSPEQTGIYLSILLKPENTTPYEATNITSMAAVAACEAIESMGKQPEIKWINDIFINKKKVSGILTEASINMETKLMDYVVMGIGLNVYAPKEGFPEDIKNIAGPILDKTIRDGRNKIAAAFINSFLTYYENFKDKTYYESYKSHSMILGQDVYIDTREGRKKVFAKDIDPNFELIIIENGKERTVSSGEVHIKL